MNYLHANCPHCGKELPIPDDAETIVCMYCAQSIDVHALLRQAEKSVKEAEQLLEQAVKSLPDNLMENGVQLQGFKMDSISAKTYPDLFRAKYEELLPALELFDKACRASENSENVIDRFAEAILIHFQNTIEAEGIKKTSDNRFFNHVYQLVMFFIPSVLEYQSEFAEPLADAFLEKWKAVYPKNPIGKATYEKIKSGFKTKLCFITTAVCQSQNRPDNCYELNTFRSFRDNWLAKTEGGTAKIQEYYLFAPMVVQAIDRSPRKDEVYHGIWQNYLVPCLNDIEQNKPESCAKLYEKMVRDLELEWL